MNQTFHLLKTVKYTGMVSTAIFLVVLTGSCVLYSLENPAKFDMNRVQAVRLGTLGIVVSGIMLLPSVYMWAAYYVERFTIDETTLSIRTLFRNRQFEVSELECLKWKATPGSIIFRGPGSRARLDLQSYSKEDKLHIIRALHDLVPLEVQQDWPMLCHAIALPLRDGEPSIIHSDPSVELYTIARWRYDRMMLIALPLSIALAITLWVWLNYWQTILFPFCVIGFWLLLRFAIQREGSTEVR